MINGDDMYGIQRVENDDEAQIFEVLGVGSWGWKGGFYRLTAMRSSR